MKQQGVINLHAVTGHGLDWLWPWLAGYPRDKVAILDDMCVLQPTQLLQPKGHSKLTVGTYVQPV